MDINKLGRDRLIFRGCYSGNLTWTSSLAGAQTATAGFAVEVLGEAGLLFRLQYTVTTAAGETHDVDLSVPLQSTRPRFGGVRWWFTCPLAVDGRPCGRRVGRLYLPPGGRYFGCRHCHDLTYTSCQESHRFDVVVRMLADRTGSSVAMAKRLLERRT